MSDWHQFSSLIFDQHKQFCLKVLRREMCMYYRRGDFSCFPLGVLNTSLQKVDNGCHKSVKYSWGKKYSAFSLLLQDYFFKTFSWQKFLKKSNLLYIRVLPSFLSTGGDICISIYLKSTPKLWNHLQWKDIDPVKS